MSKMVHTVCGEISVDDLGFVLPHEHVFCAVPDRWLGLESCSSMRELEWATRRVTADMQTWLRTHPFSNLDNLIRLEHDESLEELQVFADWGGNTVVDVSPSHGNLAPWDFHVGMKKIWLFCGLYVVAALAYTYCGTLVNGCLIAVTAVVGIGYFVYDHRDVLRSFRKKA